MSSSELADLELESHLDRSVPCPPRLGQPARVFGQSQDHGSGQQPCDPSIFREAIFSFFAFRAVLLAREGDKGHRKPFRTPHLSPRWASSRMVSNRLSHAREYSAVRPANHLSTGQRARSVWEESQRMSRNKLATRPAGLTRITRRSGVWLMPPFVY
jgi:hypothetical protein